MTSFDDLSGHRAVVTGSSRGIGYGIARRFLSLGADVVICGLDPDETAGAVHSLRGEFAGRHVLGLAGDVSDASVAARLIDLAMDELGGLDALICNAGIDIIKPAIAYGPEEWDRVVDVNLRGAFLPAQAAARRWIEDRQPGAITMTSSIAARAGVAGLAPYGASKGGIDQLVRNLAVEWAPHGIRVNAVAPGYVDNVMAGVTVHADPATEARIKAFTPLGRRATIDEIAAPFAFLSSAAASYITGAILAVDGGYTAQ